MLQILEPLNIVALVTDNSLLQVVIYYVYEYVRASEDPGDVQ